MANLTATVGRRAPDFTLPGTDGPGKSRQYGLSDYQDRWLLLLFYPRDFTLVCPTELTSISGRIEEFRQRDCDVLGISTDSVETHERWIRTPRSQGGLGGLNFPLVADETGDVCQAYGVYVPKQHLALRGLFIIDPNGVLQYQAIHNLSVGRSTEEILRVVDGLQTGGLCPADWNQNSTPMDLSLTLTTNHLLGTYRIEGLVGSGAFGSVFRAHDTVLERTVALKVRKGGQQGNSREVLEEARAAAALSHPNICTVYALQEEHGTPLIVMEFLDGRPLSNVMGGGPLNKERAVSLGRQIASGMAAAHAQRVVHGDLKPANIMVTADDTAKILDFGLARRKPSADTLDDTLTDEQPGGIYGTPRYMSPEQARGEAITSASDVFALGLILFEMVTGRPAIGETKLLEALRRVEMIEPDRLASEVPEPFAAILQKALIPHPSNRMPMAQIVSALT